MNTRAKAGGEYGTNGEYYNGGEFLPSTNLPKGMTKAQYKKVQREEERKQKEAESQRRIEKAKELYKNDPRLRVETSHPYYYAHAMELAKLDKVWETL